MGPARRRAVLDTNVLISALGWNGPERRLYQACLDGDVELCTSWPLLQELGRVMAYPKLGFSLPDRQAMIENVVRIARIAVEPQLVSIVAADPDDDAVLACALATAADVIVTGDAHLLALGTFRGIPIVHAAAFQAGS
ncbi:MAG TPA: putative toxin-antitoxin system toxin component, PIN family [Bacillota bacterium]|nr:putative toxin-antitoxin system toxin component, PIN family [Bacillota bacterium]